MKWPIIAIGVLAACCAPVLAQDKPAAPFLPPAPGMNVQEASQIAFRLGFGAGQDVGVELARMHARIAELERLCADRCQTKPAEQPK